MPRSTRVDYHGALEWLLEKEQPAVRYRALIDLLDMKESDPEVIELKSRITKKGWASAILRRQRPGGYWNSRKSLYVPKYTATNWMALILSDLGVIKDDSRVEKTAGLIFSDWLNDRTMEDISDREVCVIGNTTRMLARFGYADHPKVKRLFDWLVDDQKEDGGWHCFDSDKGTLDCWEALAAYAALEPSARNGRIRRSIERGAEFYLDRNMYREGRKKYQPWFRFHYPNHYYYDILLGLDVITSLGYGDDRRLGPALRLVEEKRRSDGKWLMDSVHPDIGPGADYSPRVKPTPFSLEEAGMPSKWITLRAMRVLKRAGNLNL